MYSMSRMSKISVAHVWACAIDCAVEYRAGEAGEAEAVAGADSCIDFLS